MRQILPRATGLSDKLAPLQPVLLPRLISLLLLSANKQLPELRSAGQAQQAQTAISLNIQVTVVIMALTPYSELRTRYLIPRAPRVPADVVLVITLLSPGRLPHALDLTEQQVVELRYQDRASQLMIVQPPVLQDRSIPIIPAAEQHVHR